jgi:hypothetical protein
MRMNFTLANDFSYRYFESLLESVKQSFELRLIGDGLNGGPTRPQLFLRHDVDVSLSRALPMAEIECQHKVRATYMFIPDSRLYNVQALAGRRVLSRLKDLGHEIAVHFDLDEARRLNGSALDKSEGDINRACQIIEDITGAAVRSVSFHRPIPGFLYGPLTIGNRVNAYARELMVNYISDSRGQWQRPVLKIPRKRGTVTQLLIHPIWWGTAHVSPEERLQEFFESESREHSLEAIADLDANLAFTVPGLRRRGESRP